MQLSTKVRYATRIVIRLARESNDEPLPTQAIARLEDISADYVAQILMVLKKAGVVSSTRGSQGGFVMARDPESLTVKDVIEAVEGPICLVPCSTRKAVCSRSSSCVTRTLWDQAGATLRTFFAGVTVQQLAAQSADIERAVSGTFEI